jgi:hypothetical protein
MRQLRVNIFAGLVLVFAMLSNAYGVTVFNDAVNDFSGSGLSPTQIGTLVEGVNQIIGTTGSGDRDYFTVTVPGNLRVTLLIEGAGTQSGPPNFLGFLGLQSGPQVTLPTNTTTAAGLLGWVHYSPTATDINILPALASAGNGAIGFNIPLGPGTYSFWLQDTTAGTFNYTFSLILSVPEPAASVLTMAGFLVLWGFYRRRVEWFS